MNEELLLVLLLLSGIGGLMFALVAYQRRREARLAVSASLTFPIESVSRTFAVLFPAGIAIPALVGVIGKLTDPWLRQHALAAVLVGVGGSVALVIVSLVLTRRFRAAGAVVYTSSSLTLKRRDARDLAVDLAGPWELAEARTTSPGGVPYQIVVVTGPREIAFTYPVRRGAPGGKAGRGPFVERPRGPVLGAEAHILHGRLLDAASLQR